MKPPRPTPARQLAAIPSRPSCRHVVAAVRPTLPLLLALLGTHTPLPAPYSAPHLSPSSGIYFLPSPVHSARPSLYPAPIVRRCALPPPAASPCGSLSRGRCGGAGGAQRRLALAPSCFMTYPLLLCPRPTCSAPGRRTAARPLHTPLPTFCQHALPPPHACFLLPCVTFITHARGGRICEDERDKEDGGETACAGCSAAGISRVAANVARRVSSSPPPAGEPSRSSDHFEALLERARASLSELSCAGSTPCPLLLQIARDRLKQAALGQPARRELPSLSAASLLWLPSPSPTETAA